MDRIGVSAETRALGLYAVTVGAAVVVAASGPTPPWVTFAIAAAVLAAGVGGAALLIFGGARTSAPRMSGAGASQPAPAVEAAHPPPATEGPHRPPAAGATHPPSVARSAEASVAAPLRRFQVDGRRGRRVIRAADVAWIEAAGNYARLHVDGHAHLYRMPLARLEAALDRERFVRVHRSAIVNLDAIEEVRTRASGDADLRLRTGAAVRLSRRYAADFHERTGRASA